MKGIILAGGLGTRLYPLTKGISKHLLPIAGKPMILYPLSLLVLANIHDILIISTPRDLPKFKKLLGDGSRYGLTLSYAEQSSPKGISDAFIIGEKFINGEQCALILGDNLFFGPNLKMLFNQVLHHEKGATVFAYPVNDPHRFGIVEIDKEGKAISLEEKPAMPKSNLAITGLYLYDHHVVDFTRSLKPSKRGELEITDLNNIYLKNSTLNVIQLGEEFTWLDIGTKESLLTANQLAKNINLSYALDYLISSEMSHKSKWIS